jgi:hypothetical protein
MNSKGTAMNGRPGMHVAFLRGINMIGRKTVRIMTIRNPAQNRVPLNGSPPASRVVGEPGFLDRWWQGTGSNCRHLVLQLCSLLKSSMVIEALIQFLQRGFIVFEIFNDFLQATFVLLQLVCYRLNILVQRGCQFLNLRARRPCLLFRLKRG